MLFDFKGTYHRTSDWTRNKSTSEFCIKLCILHNQNAQIKDETSSVSLVNEIETKGVDRVL